MTLTFGLPVLLVLLGAVLIVTARRDRARLITLAVIVLLLSATPPMTAAREALLRAIDAAG